MKNIKITYKAFIISLAAVLITSCDTGFDAMNINQSAINELEPAILLNRALYWTSPYYTSTVAGVMNFEQAIVQQIVTPFGSSLRGANYNQENPSMSNRHWNAHYSNVIKNTIDIIETYSGIPERSNVVNMARIIRAYSGLILTDSYGEVPFSEAGLGFHQEIGQPVYDTQEFIYLEILSELETATAELSVGGETVSEVLYAGDITKWKRFGYSLMLRVAMRLAERAPDVAQEYITKAINGGVMESSNDNALIRHNTEYRNTFGETLQARESANYYIPKTFIDYLLDNNDPRISIAARHPGALSGGDQVEDNRVRDPNEQIGFPIGYDNSSIVQRAQDDGVSSLYAYSQYDVTTIASNDVPFMMVTYSQTQFLLAEAVERTWATGDDVELFENGIRAHFNDLETLGKMSFDDAEVDSYVADQIAVYNSENKREHIGTQYWVANFLNPMEAWANFRRSGYPDIPPNPYPLSDIPQGEFIRRLIYPPGNDFNDNTSNIQEAINRQGPDEMDTRVWWDTELAWEP